ncbi:unnamed protein product [Linum trigynum]|uniref:Uncharacterized protein n=1 Tax=Linum trigynum TaxID=586398 RepID=A0AAV2DTB5_9ROSI
MLRLPLFSQISPSPSPPLTPVPPFPSPTKLTLPFPSTTTRFPTSTYRCSRLSSGICSSTSPPTAESISMGKEAAWAAVPRFTLQMGSMDLISWTATFWSLIET